MSPIDVDAIYAFALALFAVGLLFGALSTGMRMLSLHRRRLRQPRLIWRDVSVFGLLAADFLIIAIHRAAGLPFREEVWFAIITSAIAITAVVIYGYYERFVIGRVYERRDD